MLTPEQRTGQITKIVHMLATSDVSFLRDFVHALESTVHGTSLPIASIAREGLLHIGKDEAIPFLEFRRDTTSGNEQFITIDLSGITYRLKNKMGAVIAITQLIDFDVMLCVGQWIASARQVEVTINGVKQMKRVDEVTEMAERQALENQKQQLMMVKESILATYGLPGSDQIDDMIAGEDIRSRWNDVNTKLKDIELALNQQTNEEVSST